MARSAASYILMLDEQSSQAQNVLHTPHGVLHKSAFSDEVAPVFISFRHGKPLCSAMKHSMSQIWSTSVLHRLYKEDFFINLHPKNSGVFRFKFSVWRIERTGERHKAAQILRFTLFGDTAFMLKIGWFFAFQVKKINPRPFFSESKLSDPCVPDYSI